MPPNNDHHNGTQKGLSYQSCKILLDNFSKNLTLRYHTYCLLWHTLFNFNLCKWPCNHWVETIGGVTRTFFFCTLQLFGHMPPRCLQLFMSSISCYSNLLPLLCSYVKIHLMSSDHPRCFGSKRSTMWSIYKQFLKNFMPLYNYT